MKIHKETVLCKWCKCKTSFTDTKECDRCWDLRRKIEMNLKLAQTMIEKIKE